MPPPDLPKYLEDVRQACTLVETFTQGKSLADYQADSLLRSGVERQFITMGEALVQGEKLDPTLKQTITALREIVGFRNLLVHGYAVVQHDTVWEIIENDLTLLKQEVEGLLASNP